MTARLGIELTPSRCSLLTVEDGPGRLRISDFHTIEYAAGDTGELESELRRLRRGHRFTQRARIVIWESRAVHRSMSLPTDESDCLESRAVARAKEEQATFGGWASNTWAGVAAGDTFHLESGAPGREVLFAAMSAEDVRRRLKPFRRAGIEIETVMTPALALSGLARALPGAAATAVVAFIAMNRDMGTLLVMQGSRLLLERRLTWDYRVEHAAVQERLTERYSFAARVAAELRPAFAEIARQHGLTIDHVQLCGDLPNLRTFAMPLIAELDLEIDTLDVMHHEDESELVADRHDILEEQVASLQLAWAAAATAPLVTLSPPVQPESRVFRGARIAVAGLAAAAAVLIAVALWPTTVSAPDEPRQVAMTRSAGEPVPDPTATTGERPPGEPSPQRPLATDAREGDRLLPVEEPVAAPGVERPDEPVRVTPPVATEPLATQPTPAAATPTPARAGNAGDEAKPMPPPDETEARIDEPAPIEDAPTDTQTVELPSGGQESAAPPAAAVPEADAEPARAAEPTDAPAVPSPAAPAIEFPDVRSILYSSDRRLAIVGRQVVGVGDALGSAVVVDITPDTVVLRLPSGEERRLTLTYGPREQER